MFLKKLSLIDFKNYEEAVLQFSSKLNCFVGNNGVGKTNLLDAIHYLSLTKSYFNPIDTQNIKKQKDFFIAEGFFDKENEEATIFCSVQKNKKKVFKRNKKDYERLADHIGLFPLVMVSPADSNLIYEGGEERRKFINSVLSQFDHNYLENTIAYNRILTQRNTLLKSPQFKRNFDKDTLEVYNDQLVNYGNKIFEQRKIFIEELTPVFCENYAFISGEKEDVSLEYKSDLTDNDFAELLESSVEKDRILEHTSKGVHRDNLEFLMDSYPIKKFGSQGQQKSYTVALKLAKYDYIHRKTNASPILLLDDIFDKFDTSRVKQIIKLVSQERFGQIFITDTETERVSKIVAESGVDAKIFTINPDCSISES